MLAKVKTNVHERSKGEWCGCAGHERKGTKEAPNTFSHIKTRGEQKNKENKNHIGIQL